MELLEQHHHPQRRLLLLLLLPAAVHRPTSTTSSSSSRGRRGSARMVLGHDFTQRREKEVVGLVGVLGAVGGPCGAVARVDLADEHLEEGAHGAARGVAETDGGRRADLLVGRVEQTQEGLQRTLVLAQIHESPSLSESQHGQLDLAHFDHVAGAAHLLARSRCELLEPALDGVGLRLGGRLDDELREALGEGGEDLPSGV
mmetsp:Transcript_44962/g.126948  ORF Transcript_44962/g.126948 Transcript_44962/m.126948 type:complete len:201 (+) Transcript_44962:221-823(+)